MSEFVKIAFDASTEKQIDFENDFNLIIQKLKDKEYVGEVYYNENPNEFDTDEKYEFSINGYANVDDDSIDLFDVKIMKSVYKDRPSDTYSVQVSYPDLSNYENKDGNARASRILRLVMGLIQDELNISKQDMRKIT